MTFRCMVTICQ